MSRHAIFAALADRYHGIQNDVGLDALQRLARLHPGILGSVESAAALLTLLFQVSLIAAAWTLARGITTPLRAALGVALLIALPGHSGAGPIFTGMQPFLTPDMPAEALVLLGLAAALRARTAFAIGLTAAALLVQPLVGLAGAMAIVLYTAGRRKPLATGALAIVSVKALVLLAVFMPPGPWGRFDPEWLAMVEARTPYVFLASWSLDDATRVVVTLATLALAWQVLADGHARTLAALAAITTLAGIGLTLIASDLLHLVPFAQLQPWRWQWLGTVVAALLLPTLIADLWNRTRTSDTPAMYASATAIALPAIALTAIALGAAVTCAATLPHAWRSWTARQFPPAEHQRFAGFRRLIPPSAEVFWPESTLGVEMLLERPDYLAAAQPDEVLFSRSNAVELGRRTRVLETAGIPDSFMTQRTGGGNLRLTASQLAAACATQDFDFLVTGADIGMPPLATAPAPAATSSASSSPNTIRLYRCRPASRS